MSHTHTIPSPINKHFLIFFKKFVGFECDYIFSPFFPSSEMKVLKKRCV